MACPLILQARIDEFFHVVDFYGYGDSSNSFDIQFVLHCACNIIDLAKPFSGIPLTGEDRVHLSALPNKIGVSFSLIFHDRKSLYEFIDFTSYNGQI